MEILFPHLPEEFVVNLAVEHAQEGEPVTMQFKYSGAALNPNESDNMLSLKLAQNVTQSIAYETIDEDGFTNLVTAKIK